MTSLDHLEQARQLLADYVATVATLRRSGYAQRAAVERAGVLLADRLTQHTNNAGACSHGHSLAGSAQ